MNITNTTIKKSHTTDERKEAKERRAILVRMYLQCVILQWKKYIYSSTGLKQIWDTQIYSVVTLYFYFSIILTEILHFLFHYIYNSVG